MVCVICGSEMRGSTPHMPFGTTEMCQGCRTTCVKDVLSFFLTHVDDELRRVGFKTLVVHVEPNGLYLTTVAGNGSPVQAIRAKQDTLLGCLDSFVSQAAMRDPWPPRGLND